MNLNSRYQRLPLTALRTFEAAARLQSFKQASQELNVTAATVSNQIRRLERDWDCLLFVRKTRQVILTEAGNSLLQVVSRAFEDIKTEIETNLSQSKNTVTIAVGPIFASRWLIPRLNRFRRQHPDIELVLHHGPRLTGSDSLTTDIAVDWGTGDWPGLESTHLLDIRYLPVLSPRLAKDKGEINKSSDLERFTILHQFDRSEWDAWLQIAGGPKPEFVNETVIVDSNVIVQAAIDGQGVALGTFPFIQTEVDNGRLICPLDITLEPTRSYHLLTRVDARNSSEIMAVCNWLEKESASSPLRPSEK